jgi:hypothetical protein
MYRLYIEREDLEGFRLGVSWEVDMRDANGMEEVWTRRSDDEDGCKSGYLQQKVSIFKSKANVPGSLQKPTKARR